MRDPRRTAVLAWAAWAVLLLAVYYLQLWRALAALPNGLEPVLVLSAAKHVAALAAIALAAALVALPVGAGLEWLLGWPWLPPVRAFARRVAFGFPVLLLAAGPFAGPLGDAAQATFSAQAPSAGEAVTRALSALFGLLLVLAAALPAGQALCGMTRWTPCDWRDELLYHAALGLGVLAAVGGALAVAGFFTPVALRIVLGGLALAGVPRLYGMARRAGWWPAPRHARHPWFRRTLIGVVAVAMVTAGVTALAPETEYDALWYHLGLPKLWLEAGRPVDLVHEYVSLYPLTWELVFTAGVVAGNAVSARLLHFVCLPLAALLVWQLSVRVAPRAEPWVAVALLVTAPTVLWEATTAYVDLALALQVGLGLLALVRYVDGGGRGWVLTGALAFGLACATKHLGLVGLAIAAAGLALWLWRHHGRSLLAAVRPAAWLVALAVLVASPWYVRAWLASGNPVFPELVGLFGANPPERWDQIAEEGLRSFKARFGSERTPLNLLLLPWDATLHGARYGGTLGPLFLVLLPALPFVRRTRNALLAWLGAFAAAFVAIWASPISSFQLRFLVVIAPVLAVLAGEAARRVGEAAPGRSARAGAILLLGLLALNLPPFTPLHERDRMQWDGWLTHVVHAAPLGVVLGRESEHDYLSRHLPTYGAWQYLNDVAPADARVLTFRGGDHFYTHRQRLSSVSPVARRAAWSVPGEEDAALAALRELTVSHVLVDRRSFDAAASEIALLSERMRALSLELVYEDGGALVFAVR